MLSTMIKIEVRRESASEPNLSVLRRFSKRVQGAGILKRAKAERFASRPASHYKKKKSALVRLSRRAAYERLKKLGKIALTPPRR